MRLFMTCCQDFVMRVIEKVRDVYLIANEYVFIANDIGKELFIIHYGTVEVVL